MALSQQKFREIVFQILYSKDICKPDEEALIELMMAQLAVTKKNVKSAQDKVEKILQTLPEIDPKIESVSTAYEFDRIQTVTKNILRLGTYELLFDESIPPKVAIAEAMRLARKFGTPESASFVNALLDKIYRMSCGEAINSDQIDSASQKLADSETQSSKAAQVLKESKIKDHEE